MPRRPWQTEAVRGWRRLLAAGGVVSFLWLVVLPAIAALPAVEGYVRKNERLGIDPSVKYYSELPAMGAIRDRIESSWRRERLLSESKVAVEGSRPR